MEKISITHKTLFFGHNYFRVEVVMAKILIIGGGVSGLSAGIHALKAGHEAIICERHSVPGGNLTGWQRGRYHIDNCIHWLTGTNQNTETYKLWEELGALGEASVFQGETLYTCEYEGEKLSLYRDLERLRWEMFLFSPQDEKEIEKFITAIKGIQGLCGTAGKDHNEKSGLWKLVKSAPTLLPYVYMSTGELSKRFTHPLLKRFIACLLGDDFSAVALLMVFATFCGDDGGVPLGGSLKMAQRIADNFEGLGGRLLLKKTAKKINIVNGKAVSVVFEDGDVIPCDYVVCAADAKTTYGKLLSMPMPKALKKQFTDKRFIRFSSYHTAFACKTDELPFRGDFIFQLPKKEQVALGTKYLIVREFSHDKTFAPKGQTVLQTLTFCTEEKSKEFIKLRTDKHAYENKKMQLAETIERILVEKFPMFREKLHCLDVWTPATYHRYYGEEIGAYMGFVFPKRYLPKRLTARVKGLKNVVLATQWQQTPGGLPTAANMGRQAIKEIKRLERRFFFPWKIFNPMVKKPKRV